MSNTKQNFLQTIATAGKSFLAHVNFSFNGATGEIQINLIPTDPQSVIVDEDRKAIGQTPEVKALPKKDESEAATNRMESVEDKKTINSSKESTDMDTDQEECHEY